MATLHEGGDEPGARGHKSPRRVLHHKLPRQLTDCFSIALRARAGGLYAPLVARWISPPLDPFASSSSLSSSSSCVPWLGEGECGWRGHEDPVRRVRGRGGHGGVLRRRGGAVRALRRRNPRRQQARQQAPAPPARGALRQAPPLRRLPGEGGLHLLRGGPGALLPGLRRAHPRPRHALGQPPALPRHRHPRRRRLHLQRRRLRRPRLRPPRPAQGHRRAAAAARRLRRGAAGALAAAVPAAGLGRRRAPPVLRLRVRRQEGVAARVQGARVVRRHRPLPRPGGAQGRQDVGRGPGALRIPGGQRRGVLQAEQSRWRRCWSAPEQEG
uniref:Uncharacterized protein n=1 Tax=Setaria italica TaxID=4555 RepID=K3Z1U3_SETIT